MIEHQQVAFQTERRVRRQNHYTIGGGDICGAFAARDVEARMVGSGLTPVDTLGPEAP